MPALKSPWRFSSLLGALLVLAWLTACTDNLHNKPVFTLEENSVRQLYRSAIHREPDRSALEDYGRKMKNGMSQEELLLEISRKEPERLKHQLAQLQQAYPKESHQAEADYRELLNRQPKVLEWIDYIQNLVAGKPAENLRDRLRRSPEYLSAHPSVNEQKPAPQLADVHQPTIRQVFLEVLNREPTQADIQTWAVWLAKGHTNEDLQKALMESAEFKAKYPR